MESRSTRTQRRVTRAAGVVVLAAAMLGVTGLGGATARAGEPTPGLGGAPPRSSDPTPGLAPPARSIEARALGAHLDAWRLCQLSRRSTPSATCDDSSDVPARLAGVAAQLKTLAPLDQLADFGPRGHGGRNRALRGAARCLLAMWFEVRTALSARIRGHERSRAEGWADRVCDGVAVAGDGIGIDWALPHACAHAVDDSGRVQGDRLGDCLRTLTGAGLADAGIGPAVRRPNIVVVLTDDQRWDTIDATHSPLPELGLPAMPATWSRLAAEGVTFTDAVVTTPICGPSRGSFLTGRNTHRHGMLRNFGVHGPAGFEDDDTIATRLDDAGYRTGYLGKYANGFTDLWAEGSGTPIVPPGWDDFRVFDHSQSVPQAGFKMIENGVSVDYAGPEAPYSTDVLAAHALDFIDRSATESPDEPFALWIGTTTPHFPYTVAPRHVGAFDAYQLVTYPSTFEEDVSDKPAWIQALAPIGPLAYYAQLFFNRGQLEMQLSTDEMVATLLDRLEHHGIGDDTIFVYTSDNGFAWSEHLWYSKGCPWEECLRVPLLVRYPRRVVGPRTADGLVANVDVVPTLLGLAGVDAPADIDGVDLGDVLRGAAPVPDRDVLVESYGGTNLTYAGVRTNGWKYIRYRSGDEALYDLALDPFELEDASIDPGNADVLSELSARLDALWPGFEAAL